MRRILEPYVEDHPRIRGNYSSIFHASPVFGGSPPHTRELLKMNLCSGFRAGITPAYAGTTIKNRCGTSECKDHPRIRGNYYKEQMRHLLMPGSPPHTRELLASASIAACLLRITPAYAGTTPSYYYAQLLH